MILKFLEIFQNKTYFMRTEHDKLFSFSNFI